MFFNAKKDKVLLIEKKRPEWQVGYWNGIGSKVEEDDDPLSAMNRECKEETGHYGLGFIHCITFVCPGGTVYVFKGNSGVSGIPYKQIEDERLKVWPVNELPEKVMSNLKWLIPICLSSIQFPILIQQNTLGAE